MTPWLEFLSGSWTGVLVLFLVVNAVVWVFVQATLRFRPETETPTVPRPLQRILQPKTAAVRPRIVRGEVFPLEDELRPLIATRDFGSIRLVGGPGTGKTTAIEHLMAVLPDDPQLRFLDEPEPRIIPYFATKHLVIYTAVAPAADRVLDLATYYLAPWDRDDLIEYLLSVHEAACGSVMERLGAASPLAYRGCPEIWRAILAAMAADPVIPDARTALSNYLQWLQPDLEEFKATGQACLNQLTGNGSEECPHSDPPQNEFEKLLRHEEVQILVAAEQLAQDLQGPAPPSEESLSRNFPAPLIKETAAILADDPDAIAHLLKLLDQPIKHYSLLVSLLHGVGIEWEPAFYRDPVLSFASLEGVRWPGAELSGAVMDHADFRNADLSGAFLDVSIARLARFQGANFSGASMIDCMFAAADLSYAHLVRVQAANSCFEYGKFVGANFQEAELSNCVFTNCILKSANFEKANLTGAFLNNADLTEACLRGADLSLAKLMDAKVGDADFTRANLEGSRLKGLCLRDVCLDEANLRNADLEGCDLEELRACKVNFESANLKLAALTGTHLPGANFSSACLRGAKLADIHWEGADLRSADLQGATFHMGSSRSGLLFTGIASEGTRTGFYTDEYEEQSFRAPEDIRKANLCGADLRGAILSKVDFYLVDLRGAIYDADQAGHFRRCGAIL